jgi:hypothetical protein
MSEQVNLDTIEPGMVVYGAEGAQIGPVEAIHPASINVASHEVPRAAITHVDGEGVHLQLGKVALMARRDPDVEGASGMAAAAEQDASAVATAADAPDYAQARPHFEDHYQHWQRSRNEAGEATFRPEDFVAAEPNYRAGYAAGQDPRYAGREFDDVAQELRQAQPAGSLATSDDAAWEELRQQLREGFEYAREPRA